MSIKPLESTTVNQINLSLQTQFFPITLKALVQPSKTRYSEVKALTKISFLGESFVTITQSRGLRTSMLVPSTVTDSCIIIVRFDVFFTSLAQYENYIVLNQISDSDAASTFSYVVAQNEHDISDLPIPSLLATAHPLQLSLSVHFSQQSALASQDSIEFAREMIILQTEELAKQIQHDIFEHPFERVEALMYACVEKFDDAFKLLYQQRNIQLPFHDVHFAGSDVAGEAVLQLFEPTNLFSDAVAEFPESLQEFAHANSTPEPDQSQRIYTAQLASPVSAPASQYLYSESLLRVLHGSSVTDLPLTLFSVNAQQIEKYVQTITELSSEALYFAYRQNSDEQYGEYINCRFEQRDINMCARVFEPWFLPALIEFLRRAAFQVVIAGPPAACNLVGRTCQSILGPRLRQRILFARCVGRYAECHKASDQALLHGTHCECGRWRHANRVFPGASIQCISAPAQLISATDCLTDQELYVVDLCARYNPFKIFYRNQTSRPWIFAGKQQSLLAKEYLRTAVELSKAQIAFDWRAQPPSVWDVGKLHFNFAPVPHEQSEFLAWQQSQIYQQWAARIVGQ